MNAHMMARYTAPTELLRGHPGDAGIDLPALESVRIHPGEWINVPCGVRMELPAGTWGMIVGRSSTFFKKHLIVNTAVIDEGYRGDLFTCCFNMGTKPYDVEEGERLSQIIILPRLVEQVTLQRVKKLSPSRRGERGFGSTG